MEHLDKEVYFCSYCPKCVHWEKKEDESPCDECLSIFYREHSHKPVCFEEKEGK